MFSKQYCHICYFDMIFQCFFQICMTQTRWKMPVILSAQLGHKTFLYLTHMHMHTHKHTHTHNVVAIQQNPLNLIISIEILLKMTDNTQKRDPKPYVLCKYGNQPAHLYNRNMSSFFNSQFSNDSQSFC